MGATLRLSLTWKEPTEEEGHILTQEFAGADANDLAMLGAAEGWLNGLQKAASPASILRNAEAMMAIVQKILHPPMEPPLLTRAVAESEGLIFTTDGPLEVKAASKEALDRLRTILAVPISERMQAIMDQVRLNLLFLIQDALKRRLLTPEDVEAVFRPGAPPAAPE